MIAIGYPYYKGSPCVTTEIITDKFDVLRGRLLEIMWAKRAADEG